MSDELRPSILDYVKEERMKPFFVFRRINRLRDFFCSTAKQRMSIERISYGAKTEFGENVIIESNVVIGENCRIGSNTVIRNGVRIGDNCDIGHLCLIEEGTHIANNSTVQSQCHITAYANIESDVFFGPCVCCVNDTHMVKYHPEKGPFVPKGPVFKKGSSIGARSVILPGVVIGENAVIGAGSTVTKNVPDGEIWIGPCAKDKNEKNRIGLELSEQDRKFLTNVIVNGVKDLTDRIETIEKKSIRPFIKYGNF